MIRSDFSDGRISDKYAVPNESPLSMPRHQVHESNHRIKYNQQGVGFSISTFVSRLFVFIVTICLSIYGITEMYWVLTTGSITSLQLLFLALFSVNFFWVSFAFAQALLGFLLHLKPRLIKPKEIEAPFKTAVLLPIYNEDPVRIRASIETMRADLIKKAPGKYAFFILSDTNQADAWITEESCFLDLIDDDEAGCPVFYRHRQQNKERKAGNIGDWVQRWGGDYEAMIVLDADSIMSAESMITLSCRLAAAPEVGLIQTLPTIVFANTLYSRLQQFANQCFGPIYAEGLSAWHGLSSNFWGHNAIIRTSAFADSCHLPILEGKPPFGGHVLSHDFIEAALLRRAGWGVRFDTDIEASFEEAPPSLIDVIIRDRRWCQGNLQHTRFMFAQGFSTPTRLHLFSGVMSYLSAVFWLGLIIVGVAIAIQAKFIRPEYFSNPSLFPTWPVFDSERALSLFIVSMAVVLAPKVFGWFAAMVNLRKCLKFGGPILLTLSTVVEMLISGLYAPILMLSQFGVVVSILRGKDSGWKPQSRDDGALNWRSAIRAHTFHTLFGIAFAITMLLLSRELFYWSLPITSGLILSIPLSWLSGGARRTKWLKIVGILRSPEEKKPIHILSELKGKLAHLSQPQDISALRRLIADPELFKWHIAQLPDTSDEKNSFHAPRILAEWKVNHSDDLQQLEESLDASEILALLGQSNCMDMLKKHIE